MTSSENASAVAPTLETVQLARRELGKLVRETPAWPWQGHRIDAAKPAGATLWLKLETFQHTGSFKVRDLEGDRWSRRLADNRIEIVREGDEFRIVSGL